MAIILENQKVDQVLPEYGVGAATESCLFPGIAQCLAIVGWTPTAMYCTHVSPGISQDDMDTTFAHLKAMGGDNVMYWYIVGPCTDHFGTPKALWRKVKHIKATFSKHFDNNAATFMLLDATAERHTEGRYGDFVVSFNAINIRAIRLGVGVAFAYKEPRNGVTEWTNFDVSKFVRI